MLLLLIVKHGPAEAALDSTRAISTRLQQVQTDVDSKLGEKEALGRELELSLEEINATASKLELQSATKAKRMTEFRDQLAVLSNEREQAKAAAEELEALRAEREALLTRSEDPEEDAGDSDNWLGSHRGRSRCHLLTNPQACWITLLRSTVRASRFKQLASAKWTQRGFSDVRSEQDKVQQELPTFDVQ